MRSELSALLKCHRCSAVRVIRTELSKHLSLAEANHHLNKNQGECPCAFPVVIQTQNLEFTMSDQRPTTFVFEPIRVTADVPCDLCHVIIPEMAEAFSLLGSPHVCPKCVQASKAKAPPPPAPIQMVRQRQQALPVFQYQG